MSDEIKIRNAGRQLIRAKARLNTVDAVEEGVRRTEWPSAEGDTYHGSQLNDLGIWKAREDYRKARDEGVDMDAPGHNR